MQCACIKKYLELIYTYLKKRECTMYILAQERTTMKQPLMYVNNNITVMITSSSSFYLCRSINFFLCSSDSYDTVTSNSLNAFAEFSYFSFSSFVCNFHLSDARLFLSSYVRPLHSSANFKILCHQIRKHFNLASQISKCHFVKCRKTTSTVTPQDFIHRLKSYNQLHYILRLHHSKLKT